MIVNLADSRVSSGAAAAPRAHVMRMAADRGDPVGDVRRRVAESSEGGPCRGPAFVALALLLLTPCLAFGQETFLETGGERVVEIDRRGSAAVIEILGPPLAGRREFYRPVPPLRLRHRWILVQDPTSGVVFSAPSGVTTGIDRYESDLHLLARRKIAAVEIRALVFNVWGDLAGYLSVTVLDERDANERWALRPTWPEPAAPTHEHRTSVVWVHRVLLDDGLIIDADLAPVESAWAFISGTSFPGLPEELLVRADER